MGEGEESGREGELKTFANAAPGTSLYIVTSVANQFGDGAGYNEVPMTYHPTGPISVSGSALVKIYADPGTDVGAIVYTDGTTPSDMAASMNGYLVDP